MTLLDKAASAVTAKMLAWAIGAVLILLALLALSVYGNVTQWADHRAYRKGEADRLALAASQAGLKVTAALASAKQKDDPKLAATVSRIEGKVNKLQSQKRPPALPIQCAPGQQRMDAVNAGADS